MESADRRMNEMPESNFDEYVAKRKSFLKKHNLTREELFDEGYVFLGTPPESDPEKIRIRGCASGSDFQCPKCDTYVEIAFHRNPHHGYTALIDPQQAEKCGECGKPMQEVRNMSIPCYNEAMERQVA